MGRLYLNKIGVYLVILVGAYESSIQFLSRRSLWLDESFLALNIIHKTPEELLKPLDYNQVSPPLFLQIQWVFVHLFPSRDLGLRFFPLLCFWSSMIILFKILETLFPAKNYLIIVGLALFAFNPTILYYSSEIKQYMCDVLITLLIYYILLKNYSTIYRRYIYILVIGSVSFYLSNVTPLLLFTVSAYTLYHHFFLQKINAKYGIGIGVAWFFSFVVYYFYFIYDHPTRKVMVTYWTNANAFMPMNKNIFIWFSDRFSGLFFNAFSFGTKIGVFISLLCCIGILSLLKQKKYVATLLLISPVAIHLVLSGFKMYPFEPRLYLYSCPLIIIFCCFALDHFSKYIQKSSINRSLNITIAVLLLRVIIIHPFPLLQHENVKDCIREINKRSVRADMIYVTNLQGPTFQFYKDVNYVASDAGVVYGKSFYGHPESDDNIRQIAGFKGRVWVVSQNDESHEDRFIKWHLDLAGYKRVYHYATPERTNADLYELSTD